MLRITVALRDTQLEFALPRDAALVRDLKSTIERVESIPVAAQVISAPGAAELPDSHDLAAAAGAADTVAVSLFVHKFEIPSCFVRST